LQKLRRFQVRKIEELVRCDLSYSSIRPSRHSSVARPVHEFTLTCGGFGRDVISDSWCPSVNPTPRRIV